MTFMTRLKNSFKGRFSATPEAPAMKNVTNFPTTPHQPVKSAYERSVEEHYAMVDDGLDAIPHHKDIGRLVRILRLNRNANSPGLEMLLITELNEFDGFETDIYGNRYLSIDQPNGHPPEIMFTSHCDTVSSDTESTHHPLCYNTEKDVLFRKNGEVLGADDGTGIWIMLNMIDAKVPGLYAFFLDEETGRQGSEWAWRHTPERFDNIDRIISFDRKGTEDVIGSQRGDRCCSEEFGAKLAKLLTEPRLGLSYKPGARGSFTDSATFMDDLPECTNIAVGYDNQHTEKETQLVKHVCALRDLLCIVGHVFHNQLPVVRYPEDDIKPSAGAGYAGYGGYNSRYYDDPYASVAETLAEQHGADDEPRRFERLAPEDWSLCTPAERMVLQVGGLSELIETFPDAIESILIDQGFDSEELAEYIAFVLFGLEENPHPDDTDQPFH